MYEYNSRIIRWQSFYKHSNNVLCKKWKTNIVTDIVKLKLFSDFGQLKKVEAISIFVLLSYITSVYDREKAWLVEFWVIAQQALVWSLEAVLSKSIICGSALIVQKSGLPVKLPAWKTKSTGNLDENFHLFGGLLPFKAIQIYRVNSLTVPPLASRRL